MLRRFAGQACAASLFVVVPLALVAMQAAFAPSVASTIANIVLLFAVDVFFLPAYVRGHFQRGATRPPRRVDIDASLGAALATRAAVFVSGAFGAGIVALLTLIFGFGGIVTAAGFGWMAAAALTSVATTYAARIAILDGTGPVASLRRSKELARARPLATTGAFATGLFAYVLAAGGGGLTMLALAIAVRWARDVWMTQIVLESRTRTLPSLRSGKQWAFAALLLLVVVRAADANADPSSLITNQAPGVSGPLITTTANPVETSATIQEAANTKTLTTGVSKVVEAQSVLDRAQAAQLAGEQAFLVGSVALNPDKARQEALLKDAERLKAETARAAALVTEQQKALDAASQQVLATGGTKLVDELNQWRFDEANRRLVRSETELAKLQEQWRLTQSTGIPATKEQASLLQAKKIPLDLSLNTTEQIRLARQAELATAKQRILDQANGGQPYTTTQAVLDAASHPLPFLGGTTVGTGKGLWDTAVGIAKLPGATYSFLFEPPKYGPLVSQADKSLAANQADLKTSVQAVVDPSAANFRRGEWTGENLVAPAVTWELGSYGFKAASKLLAARTAVAAESSSLIPPSTSTVVRDTVPMPPRDTVPLVPRDTVPVVARDTVPFLRPQAKLPAADVWDIPQGRPLTDAELFALSQKPLGEGFSSKAYRAGDAVIKVPKFGGTDVIDGTTSTVNYLSQRLGPDLVPPLEMIGPGYFRQKLLTGLTYDQLTSSAQRTAVQNMDGLVARANTELAQPGAPKLVVPSGKIGSVTVDKNSTNFLFDSTGKVTGWFDPVVVTVLDQPSQVVRVPGWKLPPSDVWK